MTSRVTLNLKKQGEAVMALPYDQSHSIHSTWLKTASAPGHHQARISFPDNPTSSISIYAGPMDDAQSFGGKAPAGYDHVESAGYEHAFQ
jgi:hypothetical protein